jgi:hypothetical protein
MYVHEGFEYFVHLYSWSLMNIHVLFKSIKLLDCLNFINVHEISCKFRQKVPIKIHEKSLRLVYWQ